MTREEKRLCWLLEPGKTNEIVIEAKKRGRKTDEEKKQAKEDKLNLNKDLEYKKEYKKIEFTSEYIQKRTRELNDTRGRRGIDPTKMKEELIQLLDNSEKCDVKLKLEILISIVHNSFE